MGSAFVQNSTYTRVIGEADDAHSYLEGVDRFEVELRPLDAGDRAKIRDGLAMERPDGNGGFALGTVELLHVRAAIVSWTLAGSPAAMVERLMPEVLEAIREHVSYGRIPETPKTKAELDAASPAPLSAEAAEATVRQRADLEADELRDGELEGRVPLEHS